MSYRANLTDKNQNELEAAQYEGGINVQTGDAKTRVVMKERQGATQRTANAGSTLRNNGGVIMPHDDVPGRFVEATQGKA